MRGVPLLQAVLTLALGWAVYQRLWLGLATGCLALAWSGYLALRAWRGWGAGGDPVAPFLGDVAVTVTVMVMLAAAVPPPLLTTTFYWAAPLAQAVILLASLSMPWWLGGSALTLVAVSYGATVAARAGAASLPVAAGNVAGMAAYFGFGTVLGLYARRLALVLAGVARRAQDQEARLGILRAQAEEFGRLHDDAVQVLEQAAAGHPGSAETRAYASWAAARLRAATSQHELADGSLLASLSAVADGFATLGFSVEVAGGQAVSADVRTCSLLTAATIEALNNAYKHSGTTAARVCVTHVPGSILVTVDDHGRGFPAESVRQGFGLASSIFRRLEEAGGGATLRSAPGNGTTVRMWLPC